MGKRRRCEDEAGASERPRRGRLHLIVHDYARGCTVYKLDVDAFQPGTGTDDHLESTARHLPHDCVSIRMASPDRHQNDQFVCTGNKIFAFYKDADAGRSTMVYDSATSQVTVCPPQLAPKELAEFLTVGVDIYALETDYDRFNYKFVPSMEKLGPAPRRGWGEWRWKSLRPPPIKLPILVSAQAVHPDGSTIFLSVAERGTFSFDTGRLARTRHGSWLLPFHGEAYFVRELDAWVGLCSHQKGYIAVCNVISPDDARCECPTWTSVDDRVYYNRWKRHLAVSLTYMGNAEFCLLETITRKGYDIFTESRTRMLLRLATFRVERQHSGEVRAVNMRTMLYKCPHWELECCRSPTAFWI
ncbi:unnamed protein product [Triticum turgidum subsp. durum]|uniref:Uncharacterized protein n=1 Tax=Triticum turgidum subsp. durum TaxID=4567 RepID=A0A9R0WEU8_TRITD|nr:unnamed protein product [Triticum turgidum subsp. durum]